MPKNLLAIFAVCASLISPASAATITWDVLLTFPDGGAGSGSFTINTSTLALLSVDITTTPPDAPPSPVWTYTTHYLPGNIGPPQIPTTSTQIGFHVPSVNGRLDLFLEFGGSLLVAAPSISPVTVVEQHDDPIMGGQDERHGVATLSAEQLSAVPLPAALPLFATGLGALALLGWRRKRTRPTRA